MTDDAAFVWDSGSGAAARPRRPASPPAKPVRQPRRKAGWGTLRAAEEATGVPAATIRNWARKGRIPSEMEETATGRRRLVDIAAAVERARSLGTLRAGPPEPAPDADPQTEDEAPPVREDHVLVPMDAWEKMLLQLGNLHAAGQELAEARERAAKAETEAAFLRERIAEMRERPREPAEAAPDAPEPAAEPAPRWPSFRRRYRVAAERFWRRRSG